jgi:hypothetical protein
MAIDFREYDQKIWPNIWYVDVPPCIGSWRSPIDETMVFAVVFIISTTVEIHVLSGRTSAVWYENPWFYIYVFIVCGVNMCHLFLNVELYLGWWSPILYQICCGCWSEPNQQFTHDGPISWLSKFMNHCWHDLIIVELWEHYILLLLWMNVGIWIIINYCWLFIYSYLNNPMIIVDTSGLDYDSQQLLLRLGCDACFFCSVRCHQTWIARKI